MLPSPNFSRNVDWNLLKTFHEIAEAGGVSRAGRALRRKQPALSLALKRLETELGVTLCRRGPRGFELTDEGMLVAETCRSLNSLVRNVPKRLGNLTEEVRGRISIQIISSLVCERFDAAISRFHGRHPDVEILIDITTWTRLQPHFCVTRLISVWRRRRPCAPISITTSCSMSSTAPIAVRAIRFMAGRSTTLRRSRGQAFVLTGADEPDVLTAYRTRHCLGLNVAGLSEHLDEAKRLTTLGIGICFLPEAFAAPDVEAGRLWPLLGHAEQPSMPVFVITNPRAPNKLARHLLLTEIGVPCAAN